MVICEIGCQLAEKCGSGAGFLAGRIQAGEKVFERARIEKNLTVRRVRTGDIQGQEVRRRRELGDE